MTAWSGPGLPGAGAEVPEAMRGAWVRDAYWVDGRPVPSPARVLWVQGVSSYADLRVPVVAGGEVVSFAGTARWDGERLRWHHTLDRTGWEGDDVAVVRWRGDDLVETGVLVVDGCGRPYEEVWRRTGGGEGDEPVALAGEADDGRLAGLVVAAGGYAVAVVDHRPAAGFVAASWRQPGAGAPWAVLDVVGGAGAATPPAPPTPDRLPAVGEVVDGPAGAGGLARWRVVERGGYA